MGCVPSGSVTEHEGLVAEEHHKLLQWLADLLSTDDPRKLLAAYVEIEKVTSNEESRSPSSKLSFALSRLQHIKELLQSVEEKREKQRGPFPQQNSIYDLFVDLGLRQGSSIIAEHEEFIADINRRELNDNLIDILKRMQTDVEKIIESAVLDVGRLQILYERQEQLLRLIYGESRTERDILLEKEINTMRSYRDTLFYGVCQWEESTDNVRSAVDLIVRSLDSWRSLQNHRQVKQKIDVATETRNGIQEAILLVQICQDFLPEVQFPYCTKRELSILSQAIEYAFTDVLIEDRYSHALRVYANFQEKATLLWRWMNQILTSSLKRDVIRIDSGIMGLARNLRSERINAFCDKFKIENPFNELFDENLIGNGVPTTLYSINSDVQAPHLAVDNSIHLEYLKDINQPEKDINNTLVLSALKRSFEDHSFAEFEKNLAERRNTMWPSRRIEELRMMIPKNSYLLKDKKSTLSLPQCGCEMISKMFHDYYHLRSFD